MKPPICNVCYKKFDFDGSGEDNLVEFSDYKEPSEDAEVHHPVGQLWFCERHIQSARRLHHLTSWEAVEILTAQNDQV
jgi:hypothetical protein